MLGGYFWGSSVRLRERYRRYRTREVPFSSCCNPDGLNVLSFGHREGGGGTSSVGPLDTFVSWILINVSMWKFNEEVACLFDCLFDWLMDWFELFFFVLRNDCLNWFCIDQFCLKDMTSALIGNMLCRWMYGGRVIWRRSRQIAQVCWTALLWLSYLKSYNWYNSSTTLV